MIPTRIIAIAFISLFSITAVQAKNQQSTFDTRALTPQERAAMATNGYPGYEGGGSQFKRAVGHRKASEITQNRSFGSGTIRSAKTGATAHVGAAYAGQFQAYIDAIEATGATVRFMGGIRAGRCWAGGLHPCGKALDVCQLRRGVVDARCHLPGPVALASIASQHGLFEGGQWCNSDYGHAQVGVTAGACGTRSYSAKHRHAKYVHRHLKEADLLRAI